VLMHFHPAHSDLLRLPCHWQSRHVALTLLCLHVCSYEVNATQTMRLLHLTPPAGLAAPGLQGTVHFLVVFAIVMCPSLQGASDTHIISAVALGGSQDGSMRPV
jgi:hypothetical protein